jgi:hypothetical protein
MFVGALSAVIPDADQDEPTEYTSNGYDALVLPLLI